MWKKRLHTQQINAKQSTNFKKNSNLLEEPVYLRWTSRKGFLIGVVLSGPASDMPIIDNFSTNSESMG
ncbi:hypothetical protein, partial [Klebsiella pneumoniae]|uniref:hypothetical protein n=1 Tax=Klebsiella pneumoniae TaxID=573 RepID=UPI0023B332E9